MKILASALKGGRPSSLEDSFGLAVGAANSEEEYSALWGQEGAGGAGGMAANTGFQQLKLTGTQALDKIRKTREARPEVVIAAHERLARRDLAVLRGEAWS